MEHEPVDKYLREKTTDAKKASYSEASKLGKSRVVPAVAKELVTVSYIAE
jgi:hypothetical protein